MAHHNGKSRKEFYEELAEARKDPQFRKEIQRFIKMTTSVYRLKDHKILE